MAFYRNINTGEIRQIDLGLVADWHAANNPKAAQWEPYTPLPPPPPPLAPDWDQLRLGLQTQNGFDQAFRAAFQASPMVGTSLSSRLDAFQLSGNYSLFLQGMQSALSLLPAQEAAHIAIEFLALSQACNMPSDFLEALQDLLEPPTP